MGIFISKSISKKGVSPLIATILLIAFAVALGSVVMNWGLNIGASSSNDKCRNVELKIRNINGGDVCFGGFGANGYINFIIDNTGRADIIGLSIWIVGEKGTKLFELDDIMIEKGSLFSKKDKGVDYDFITFGNIKQIQFTPKINADKTTELCVRNTIKAEKVGACA